MNRDLFLAILSLDSYNRGYGVNIQGLAVPEFNPDGSKRATVRLGMADLSYDSVALLGPNAEAAGFYAIAYELPPGSIEDLSGTVISYRGTTFDSDDLPYATASSPLRWMTERSRSAGPPGFFAPRSQSETRFFDTLR